MTRPVLHVRMRAPGAFALALALAGSLAALSPALAAAPKTPAKTTPPKKHRTILNSPDLWATVDVCNTPAQPDTIGIRASMPGDGRRAELMFMRFRVQYQDPTTLVWTDSAGADTGYVRVGSAKFSALQSGTSFQFKPAPGDRYVLRGAVGVEWRVGARVVRFAHIHTTAGHHTTVGSDPKGYSAAICTISG
jgi:hypothetical protein